MNSSRVRPEAPMIWLSVPLARSRWCIGPAGPASRSDRHALDDNRLGDGIPRARGAIRGRARSPP